MTGEERDAIRELRSDLQSVRSKLDAIMSEQQNGANGRLEIKETQADIKRELSALKDDMNQLKPAVAHGKRIFYLAAGLILGTGFSLSEIKTWLIKALTVVPCILFAMSIKLFAQVTPWVDQLRTPGGTVCCSNNDGRRLDDPEWRVVGEHYEVLFTEGWIAVPEEAVVQMRNQDGIARVWSDVQRGQRVIRCFIAGSWS